MNNMLMPQRPGQVCQMISDVPDKEPEEIYIVAENPADFNADDDILVVNLRELQRNITHPENAERIAITKNQLVVVGEDLASYVQSWNAGK